MIRLKVAGLGIACWFGGVFWMPLNFWGWLLSAIVSAALFYSIDTSLKAARLTTLLRKEDERDDNE